MDKKLSLPEGWQESPEAAQFVAQAVEKALQEAQSELKAERDALLAENSALKAEAKKISEAKEKPAEGAAANTMPHDPEKRDRRQADYEARIAKLEETVEMLKGDLEAKEQQLAEELIERGIREAVADVGEVYINAWPDVIARGKRLFALNEEGDMEARTPKGELVFGRDGVKSLTIKEWARELQANAPHLFKAATRAPAEKMGAGAPAAPAAGRVVAITPEQALNPIAYRRARELAQKRGVELVIQ